MAEDLDRYLRLTVDGARSQWRRVLARTNVPAGKRQEDFSSVEVVLSFGLFFVTTPTRWSSKNLHQLPSEVHALAQTCKRPPRSFIAKMMNLDGSRPNGQREEPELFLRFGLDPAVFAHIYRVVIDGARAAGLDQVAVPDFLGLLGHADAIDILGQDELGPPAVAEAVESHAAQRHKLAEVYNLNPIETSRIVEQRIRLGQHRFAQSVLANFRRACAFCGFKPGVLRGARLLVASHVKPWAASNDGERLDPTNGVCACPMHDSAFDGGLLTIDRSLAIIRAPELEAAAIANHEIDRFFGFPPLRVHLELPPGSTPPKGKYLDYHQREIFRR